MNEEVHTDLLTGMTFTSRNKLIEMKSRRESLIDQANQMKLGFIRNGGTRGAREPTGGSSRGPREDHGSDGLEDEESGLLGRENHFTNLPQDSATFNRLMNIKRLADGVRDKSEGVAKSLNKDTEGIQQALARVG